MYTLSFLLLIVKKHIHVIVEQHNEEMYVDRSGIICRELLKKFDIIPNKVEELKLLIDAPLLRQLPVTSDEERMFPDISNYVRTAPKEKRSDIAKIISHLF